MNDNKKRIRSLINADIVTVNGGKNNMKWIMILLFAFFGGFGFLFTPVFGLNCPLIVGLCFVPMIFRNELKYHSENMYNILPIRRRDLVNARFVLCMGLYAVLSVIFYLLMLLSLIIKPYYFFLGEMGENIDILAMMATALGAGHTEFGLFNLLYSGVFSLGFIAISSSLRKYFKNSSAFDVSAAFGKNGKKANRQELVLAGVIFVGLILMVLMVSGVIPMGGVILPIYMLFNSLLGAANGILLSVAFLTVAACYSIHKYICTVLEYDEKEL